MLNLAVLLEDSARNVPDRVAVACGPTRLTYAELDAKASQVAGALAARGIGPGDRVALSCPNLPYFPAVYYGILKAGATVVPLNILLTEREIAYHLEDSAARAYFCFEGTAELPVGQAGRAAFDRTGSCEHFVLLTADPDATSPSPDTETLAEFTHRQPTAFASAATSEDRHRGHPVHQRHDGAAQGRRADAQQHGAQRAARQPAVRPAPARRAPAHAPAVPLLRPDRADERRVRHRRDDRAAAPVRRRHGAGAHAGRAGDLLRGRSHHVPRAAELRGDRPVRHRRRSRPGCGSPSPAAPRCPWSCCAGSRSGSRCRSWRATACPRPARSPPSTGWTGRAGPARSACRSGASRSGSSGTTGRRPTTVSQARSRSAATT